MYLFIETTVEFVYADKKILSMFPCFDFTSEIYTKKTFSSQAQ